MSVLARNFVQVSTRFRLLYWLHSVSDKQLHYGRSIRKLRDPYCSHSANKNHPSPTELVSSRRSDGWAAAIGRWEWGGLLGVKSKRHDRDVAASWVLSLPAGSGPSVMPGELTARRGATRVQRPSLCGSGALLCSCRVLDLQTQHTGLSERRNVPPSEPRSSGDALILFSFLCYVCDGVTRNRSAA